MNSSRTKLRNVRPTTIRRCRCGFSSGIVLTAIAILGISMTLAISVFSQRSRLQRMNHDLYQLEELWQIGAEVASRVQPTLPITLDLSPAQRRGEIWITRIEPTPENDYQVRAAIQRNGQEIAAVTRTIQKR